jgi:AcrR family transcriptional regulator
MSYRDLPDIDHQILESVIEETSKSGIGKVSTRNIAAACHISDFTIFQHFNTKENLLASAYHYIENQVMAIFQHFAPGEDMKEAYFQMMDFLVDNPKYVNYLRAYESSLPFTYSNSVPKNPHYVELAKSYVRDPEILAMPDDVLVNLFYFIDHASIYWADCICKGQMKYDEMGKALIIKTVFGYIHYYNIIHPQSMALPKDKK